MARALTASEATSLLMEKLNISNLNETYYIEDNDYTKRFGVSNFEWVNPITNDFDEKKDLVYWTAKGTRFSIGIYEWNGQSNVLLYMWNGGCGKCVASYNKMKAAEKKEFLEMCLNSKRVSYDVPFTHWSLKK